MVLLRQCLLSSNHLKSSNVSFEYWFHVVICKNSKALSKCDKKTFNLIIDAAAEAGDFKRVSRVVHYSYKKWKTDASYLEHAVE